ncbi:MAG: hypothetical protein ISR86_13755 [Nitrospinaceae bacterium]|nr:hypothetical protein [Nitrospinaceae bacterium]
MILRRVFAFIVLSGFLILSGCATHPQHDHGGAMLQKAGEDLMSSKNVLTACLNKNRKDINRCQSERSIYEVEGQTYHTLKGH